MISKGILAHSSVLFLVCFLALIGSDREARAQNCATRHFYNHSKVSFQISFSKNGSCSIGDVNKANPCTIPPGMVADLHYGNYPLLTESVTIESLDSGGIYPQTSFGVNWCYIHHDGNTGNIVVNDRADGDVHTCGHDNDPNGGYDCQ
jgi:hypothetical protein